MTGRVERLTRMALLLALATVIHTVEALLPVTAGWFRPGLANIVGLTTLFLYGFKEALFVTLGRVFLGSLATGLFGSPAFLLSLSGGVSAMAAMGSAHRYGRRRFSVIGISLFGAVFHNIGQLFMAYLLIIRHEGVLLLLPVMILTAAGTGLINGVAARFFIDHFRKVTRM
ncbi:MAG: Gx transporter family protein [Pseudomonadota bacterium]